MTGGPARTLITGATGFLGAALAEHFLALGDTVRCVVRGATQQERAAKVDAALGGLAPEERARVEIVAGDLGQPDLGLPEAEFAALGQETGRIVHCGAQVHMTLPYASLHQANVAATESLLALAESQKAAFCYVGSLAAVAPALTGEPFELVDPVQGGYGQSKWAADRLVSVAHQERRVRAVILRPGRVTADSRTARANPGDLLERILRCCVRLGAVPLLDGAVRISPVDWVSSLMTALSLNEAAYGHAYHIVSGQTLPWSEVTGVLRGAGYDLAALPYEQWRKAVYDAGRTDEEFARIAASLPEQSLSFDSRPRLRPARARRLLGDAYPALPPAADLLAATVKAWQAAGELPAPATLPCPAPGGAG